MALCKQRGHCKTKDLQSFGGLGRTLDLIEAAAEGRFPELLPHVQEKMSQVDPLFLRDHGVEKTLSVIFLILMICVLLICCRLTFLCCCCRCCQRGPKQRATEKKKDQ